MAKTRKKDTRKTKTIKSKTSPLNLKAVSASWLETVLDAPVGDGASAELFIELSSKVSAALKSRLESHEIDSLSHGSSSLHIFVKQDITIFVKKLEIKQKTGDLAEAPNSQVRNAMGSIFSDISSYCLSRLKVFLSENKPDIVTSVLLGLEIAAYKYKQRIGDSPFPWRPSVSFQVKDRPLSKTTLFSAIALGKGINVARHLVNLPPNLLQPESYANAVNELFKESSAVKVMIWDENRLKKENMGLLLGVGQASEYPPRLVHLRYRPKGSSTKKPIAFVGKGITFDTGGLDLKPPQFMRWMKKDMGGSAAVVGLLRWAELSNLKKPLDIYLALAENSVSDEAFRPGDVLTARSGATVEIHNTDAEGRLALADAIDVAVTQKGKDAPEKIIDVATLTGAIKAGLGADVAGLFSNDPKMRAQIASAAEKTGDYCWPMPLFRPYWDSMGSPVSDFANCTDGFGGAIIAALFLEKFTREVPWAHLDIYAWTDGVKGALREKGGNGQAVLLLSEFLS